MRDLYPEQPGIQGLLYRLIRMHRAIDRVCVKLGVPTIDGDAYGPPIPATYDFAHLWRRMAAYRVEGVISESIHLCARLGDFWDEWRDKKAEAAALETSLIGGYDEIERRLDQLEQALLSGSSQTVRDVVGRISPGDAERSAAFDRRKPPKI